SSRSRSILPSWAIPSAGPPGRLRRISAVARAVGVVRTGSFNRPSTTSGLTWRTWRLTEEPAASTWSVLASLTAGPIRTRTPPAPRRSVLHGHPPRSQLRQNLGGTLLPRPQADPGATVARAGGQGYRGLLRLLRGRRLGAWRFHIGRRVAARGGRQGGRELES